MSSSRALLDIVKKQKAGVPLGICSVCSANRFVLESALEFGLAKGLSVLIEATSNQVNQYGGYTGMEPEDFRDLVLGLAEKVGFPTDQLLLGGDHLGPNPWRNEPAEAALEKGCAMVFAYAAAGYTKIHLDASMHLGGDPGKGERALDTAVVAERTAQLAQAAERGYAERLKDAPSAEPPVYVIGSEVPVPGGTQSDHEELSITKPEDFRTTVELTREAFLRQGLEQAWERVIAVVVQPGVEFGDQEIHLYEREKAQALTEELKHHPNLVFEAHSTDYQLPCCLQQMVQDGLAILKVGPELTFALREALFALQHIEEELAFKIPGELSHLRETVERVMLAEPKNWQPYYKGTEEELRYLRQFGLSDRIRYYWSHPKVAMAVDRLLANLRGLEIPLPLLYQYFPELALRVQAGWVENSPEALVKSRIARVYEKYLLATQP